MLQQTTSGKLMVLGVVAAFGLAVGCGGGGEQSGATQEEAPAKTAEYFKVDPATAATVTGKVTFEGTVPKEPPINMSAEPDCLKQHSGPVYPNVVEVKDGKLANVFIWVKSGLEGKNFEPPTEPAKLEQKGCVYLPHVVALQTNQPFEVTNDDPFTHNVHPAAQDQPRMEQVAAAGLGSGGEQVPAPGADDSR